MTIFNYNSPTYKPLDICFIKGEGVWIYDDAGKVYLDCLSAYGALNFGHCNSEIIEKIISQSKILNVISGVVYNDKIFHWFDVTKNYLEFTNSILLTSGTEAVDVAIKFMRIYGQRVKGIKKIPKIIVFKGNYHGQSNTILSFSDLLDTSITSFDNSFISIEYNRIDEIQKYISSEVCGVLVEPIQCQNGFIIPNSGFLKYLKEICEENDLILTVDEVQTGLGRTGKLFCYEHDSIIPDITVIGKSLGGGVIPVSSVLFNKKVGDCLKMGDHGGTFANNTLSAYIASYSIIKLFEDKLIQNSKITGDYLLSELRNILLKHSNCKSVYGIGLLICIELNCDAEIICHNLLKFGVFCKATRRTKIRITPPLTISRSECDFIIEAFQKVFS